VKRLAVENINTPAHFDEVWQMEGAHRFDRVRMEAFTDYVRPRMKVLDVGAGLFGWAEYLVMQATARQFSGSLSEAEGSGNIAPGAAAAALYDVHAIDFSPVAVNSVKSRWPMINYELGDVLKMPYEDGTFDVVGAGELIEHMEAPGALVHEMARVTKRGGWMIIGTVDPNCEDSIRNQVEYPEHLWEFTQADLLSLVSFHGRAHFRRVGNYDFVYCNRT